MYSLLEVVFISLFVMLKLSRCERKKCSFYHSIFQKYFWKLDLKNDRMTWYLKTRKKIFEYSVLGIMRGCVISKKCFYNQLSRWNSFISSVTCSDWQYCCSSNLIQMIPNSYPFCDFQWSFKTENNGNSCFTAELPWYVQGDVSRRLVSRMRRGKPWL